MPLPAPAPATPGVPSPRGAAGDSWQSAAACVRLPARTVFAQHAADAAPALRACAVCTVRRECEETVAPAESWFDGVCAGRLWHNGRPVAAAAVLAVLTPAGPGRARA